MTTHMSDTFTQNEAAARDEIQSPRCTEKQTYSASVCPVFSMFARNGPLQLVCTEK